MAARDDTDLFMSVRLDDGGRICNVLVSSQTTGQDVVECLKPDDDKIYYLVELWKGCERPISNQEKLKSVLLQWGSDVDDVAFMLKRKHASSRQNRTQRKTESPRGSPRGSPRESPRESPRGSPRESPRGSPRESPVQFQDQIQEQQMKVESMERELHEKEAYLKAVRSKEGSKNSLKTKYVRHLESKVLEQEAKLKSLRSLQDEHFKCQVDNKKLKLELHRLRSMFALKHEELSDATARVELLTHELAQRSQGDVLNNDHGLLFEEMSKNDEKTKAILNELQRQRYVNHQHGDQPLDGSLGKHNLAEHKMPRPTEAQMARLHANMLRNKAATDANGRPSSAGKPDGGVLEHVVLLENDDLNSLLSWRDDEENDTETSADSGHVSVDSPSYHNGGIGTSFQFNGNGPAKYFEKVERFDMDQDVGTQVRGETARKELGLIGGNTLSHDLKDLKVSPVVNAVSHQVHSPSKTAAPRGNTNTKFPGGQANYNRPLFVQTNNERRSPGPLQSKRTQSNHDSPQSTSSLSSQSSQLSASNSDAEVRGSSPKVSDRERTNLPPSKEPPRSTHAGENCVLPRKETKIKVEVKVKVKETTIDRTAGSISHYQRNRGDCESPTPKDHFPPRVTEPRGETKGRLSPRVIDPKEDTKDRRPAVPPSKPRVETKDRLSPLIIDSKVETKDRLSSPVTDAKLETSGGENKPHKKTMPGVVRQPVPSVGVQDLLDEIPILKVTAREVKPLQIQTKAEKDSENINQTLLVNVTAKTTPVQSPTQGPKSTVDGKPRGISRVAPKPVPRKRAKTPPARNSGNEANLVVTSARTVNESVTNSSEDSTLSKDNSDGQKRGLGSVAKEQVSDGGGSREQKPETSDVCQGSGPTVGESSLRRKDRKGKKKSGKRVSLDPHAVLLHASLEGELELVKTIIHQVEDPSYPNTEGLTALHHAVCNSHDDIVKFLIEYGCDINAADMQGWTSLHCAAANNGVVISKFLVTHGACVFAVTAIEGKTPSRCCEKDAEHFEECFTYLSDLENNFGVSKDGVVYAVYAYQANRKDELSFECGERFTVIRRGDVTEKEWWWARDSRNQFGYIPRNLLGLCPRIAPDV